MGVGVPMGIDVTSTVVDSRGKTRSEYSGSLPTCLVPVKEPRPGRVLCKKENVIFQLILKK